MSKTIYIVYKTINTINDKFYIGVHKQQGDKFDHYLGSGTIINKAIKKYGSKHFIRETLHTFDTPEEAFNKEAEIVTPEMLLQENNYNALIGGNGVVGNLKGSVTAKDKDGNFHYVSTDDPRYLSGELVHGTKGTMVVRDKDGNTFQLPVDDPRIKSGEVVHINKGRDSKKMKGRFLVENKEGHKIRLKKDDPRVLSGEYVSVLKGKPLPEEWKEKMRQTKLNQPKYKCKYCGMMAIKSNIARWHNENCKHKNETVLSVM